MPKLEVPHIYQNGTWGYKRIRVNFFETTRKFNMGTFLGTQHDLRYNRKKYNFCCSLLAVSLLLRLLWRLPHKLAESSTGHSVWLACSIQSLEILWSQAGARMGTKNSVDIVTGLCLLQDLY